MLLPDQGINPGNRSLDARRLHDLLEKAGPPAIVRPEYARAEKKAK